MHIGLMLLCPCAQADRPTDRQKKTIKSTGECGKTNKNVQKMSLGVKGELTQFFFWGPFGAIAFVDWLILKIYIYINKKNYLPMAQRAPHRKMFLFIYVYIYFLYDFTYGRAISFFCFSNRPGTVLGCRAHF